MKNKIPPRRAYPKKMAVTCGIDYDGVIADTSRVKSQWIRKNLGRKIPTWKTDRTQCVPLIGLENYEKMSRAVYEKELSLKAPAVPGVRNALHQLRRKGKIYIVTARKREQIAYAKAWLQRQNLSHLIDGFYAFVKEGSKDTIARKYGLKVLIDDDLRHLKNSTNKKLLKIWLKVGGERAARIPKNVYFCKSWREALQIMRKQKIF